MRGWSFFHQCQDVPVLKDGEIKQHFFSFILSLQTYQTTVWKCSGKINLKETHDWFVCHHGNSTAASKRPSVEQTAAKIYILQRQIVLLEAVM